MIQNIIVIPIVAAAAYYLVTYFRRSKAERNPDQPCAHCAAKKRTDSR